VLFPNRLPKTNKVSSCCGGRARACTAEREDATAAQPCPCKQVEAVALLDHVRLRPTIEIIYTLIIPNKFWSFQRVLTSGPPGFLFTFYYTCYSFGGSLVSKDNVPGLQISLRATSRFPDCRAWLVPYCH
jgi:hypothetical protein